MTNNTFGTIDGKTDDKNSLDFLLRILDGSAVPENPLSYEELMNKAQENTIVGVKEYLELQRKDLNLKKRLTLTNTLYFNNTSYFVEVAPKLTKISESTASIVLYLWKNGKKQKTLHIEVGYTLKGISGYNGSEDTKQIELKKDKIQVSERYNANSSKNINYRIDNLYKVIKEVLYNHKFNPHIHNTEA